MDLGNVKVCTKCNKIVSSLPKRVRRHKKRCGLKRSTTRRKRERNAGFILPRPFSMLDLTVRMIAQQSIIYADINRGR